MGILPQFREMNMDQLTFLSEEPHVNPSASQASEEDWMMIVATWRLSFLDLLNEKGPSGWFGRTSPASCHQTEEGILVPYSEAWSNAGMGSLTECLTLSISEWPKDAAVCSLSDTLETGDLPQKFFLSAKACAGILRRAEKRGKKLPELLHQALQQVTIQAEVPNQVK